MVYLPGPVVILDSCRVLDPEDEEVPDEDNDVKHQEAIPLEDVLQEELQEAGHWWHWTYRQPKKTC